MRCKLNVRQYILPGYEVYFNPARVYLDYTGPWFIWFYDTEGRYRTDIASIMENKTL